jgi:hypothetical protein
MNYSIYPYAVAEGDLKGEFRGDMFQIAESASTLRESCPRTESI